MYAATAGHWMLGRWPFLRCALRVCLCQGDVTPGATGRLGATDAPLSRCRCPFFFVLGGVQVAGLQAAMQLSLVWAEGAICCRQLCMLVPCFVPLFTFAAAEDFLMTYTKQASRAQPAIEPPNSSPCVSAWVPSDRAGLLWREDVLDELCATATRGNAVQSQVNTSSSCPGTPGSRSRTPSVAFTRPPSWESLKSSMLEDFVAWQHAAADGPSVRRAVGPSGRAQANFYRAGGSCAKRSQCN